MSNFLDTLINSTAANIIQDQILDGYLNYSLHLKLERRNQTSSHRISFIQFLLHGQIYLSSPSPELPSNTLASRSPTVSGYLLSTVSLLPPSVLVNTHWTRKPSSRVEASRQTSLYCLNLQRKAPRFLSHADLILQLGRTPVDPLNRQS